MIGWMSRLALPFHRKPKLLSEVSVYECGYSLCFVAMHKRHHAKKILGNF
jgi:hypothetical protein